MHGNRGRVMNKVDVWYVEEEWMGCMEENVCSMLGETYTCGLGRRSMSMISLIFFRLKWNVQIWFKYFMEQMDVYGGRNRPISLTSSSVNTSAMGGWVFSITSSWICWKFDKFQWCCSQIYFFLSRDGALWMLVGLQQVRDWWWRQEQHQRMQWFVSIADTFMMVLKDHLKNYPVREANRACFVILLLLFLVKIWVYSFVTVSGCRESSIVLLSARCFKMFCLGWKCVFHVFSSQHCFIWIESLSKYVSLCNYWY